MRLRIYWPKTNGKVLLVSLCLLAAIAACIPSTDSDSDLAMSLVLDRNTYQIGQPISVTLLIENTASVPLLLQARMAVNIRQLCPSESCDLHFMISDPTGEELEFQWLARIRSIDLSDFVELSPRERYQFGLPDLTLDYAPFDKPGRYIVHAVYENQSDPNHERTAWKGKLTSNSVTFEIEP